MSAFIKSIRGSDPDAALFWLARMLEAGEDPRFIVRRLIVHASEDIGLADPMALLQATAAAHAVEHVGLPEARLNLAQATIYLARAPKSNSVYTALAAAQQDALGAEPVPAHLRDASYGGARALGHGKGYVYPHDEPGHWVDILERKLYDIDRADIHERTDGSDDGFLYCRGFIVGMGQRYYEAVRTNPDVAARRTPSARRCATCRGTCIRINSVRCRRRASHARRSPTRRAGRRTPSQTLQQTAGYESFLGVPSSPVPRHCRAWSVGGKSGPGRDEPYFFFMPPGPFRARLVRVGQLHGLFGRGDRLGLAAGGGEHVREYQVPFPLLRPAADPARAASSALLQPAEPQRAPWPGRSSPGRSPASAGPTSPSDSAAWASSRSASAFRPSASARSASPSRAKPRNEWAVTSFLPLRVPHDVVGDGHGGRGSPRR